MAALRTQGIHSVLATFTDLAGSPNASSSP